MVLPQTFSKQLLKNLETLLKFRIKQTAMEQKCFFSNIIFEKSDAQKSATKGFKMTTRCLSIILPPVPPADNEPFNNESL